MAAEAKVVEALWGGSKTSLWLVDYRDGKNVARG
jgi:hypothetical protein